MGTDDCQGARNRMPCRIQNWQLTARGNRVKVRWRLFLAGIRPRSLSIMETASGSARLRLLTDRDEVLSRSFPRSFGLILPEYMESDRPGLQIGDLRTWCIGPPSAKAESNPGMVPVRFSPMRILWKESSSALSPPVPPALNGMGVPFHLSPVPVKHEDALSVQSVSAGSQGLPEK